MIIFCGGFIQIYTVISGFGQGKYRTRELNIGVAPELIATQVRQTFDNILYRWEETDDWNAHQLGITVHAELVHIHPFTDGNGRTTRLLANLVFLSAQTELDLCLYDWNLDKPTYITLLREYDQHRDSTDLACFVQTRPFI